MDPNYDTDDEIVSLLPVTTKRQRVRKFFAIKLEPVIFLFFFSVSFNSVIFPNLIIRQTCTAIYGYNETICNLLGTKNATEEVEKIEKIVQPYALRIFMVASLVGTIMPAIINLFIGPWSDKFGRKPVLMTAVTGYFCSYVLLIVMTFLSSQFTITPWIFILTAIPFALIGGICTLLSGIYCYTIDTTIPKLRPYKLAMVGAYISLGMFLGSLSSGYASEVMNAITMFGITAVIVVIAGVYLKFFVEESLKADQIQQTSKIRGMFQWSIVRDMFKTLLKGRARKDSAILWIFIIVLCGSIFVSDGTSNVFFLFVRGRFSWTVKDLTTYDACSTVVGTIGGVIGILFLQKILRCSPTSLALIGIGSAVVDCVIKATATSTWHLYLAVGITIMKGIAVPMCRSMISDAVPPSEIGTIFSLTTTFEFLMPMVAAPLYTYVYSATLNTYPGAFNIIGAGIYFICYILVTVLFGMEVSSQSIPYGPLDDS